MTEDAVETPSEKHHKGEGQIESWDSHSPTFGLCTVSITLHITQMR